MYSAGAWISSRVVQLIAPTLFVSVGILRLDHVKSCPCSSMYYTRLICLRFNCISWYSPMMPQELWSRIVSIVSTFPMKIRLQRSQGPRKNSNSTGSHPWEIAQLDSNYQGEGWLYVSTDRPTPVPEDFKIPSNRKVRATMDTITRDRSKWNIQLKLDTFKDHSQRRTIFGSLRLGHRLLPGQVVDDSHGYLKSRNIILMTYHIV